MGKESKVRQSKSAQLQIRVSPAQKVSIERSARGAGMDMSAYVLNLVLPDLPATFAARVGACRDDAPTRLALAELNSFLSSLAANELRKAVAALPPVLTEYLANYVAAMVEYACDRAKIPAPAWTRSIKPLAEPYFGSTLQSLRLYLLTHSPAPFRSRNLFIDSSVGARV
jgi:uncharacterized protein (DUF1778 family)